MHGMLADHFDYYDSTPGRRLLALRQTLEVAQAMGVGRVVEATERALEINREAGDLQSQWRRSRQVDETTREDAAEIDNELDRTIGVLHSQLQFNKTLFPDSPRGEIAEQMLTQLFPDGAAGITHLAFERELAAVEYLLGRVDRDWSHELGHLEIEGVVEKLADLADRFKTALLDSDVRETTWDEVRHADARGQDAMLHVVATIIAEFGTDSEADVEARGRLLLPIRDQDQRIGELHKRNRKVTDVDPETGEEEIPDDRNE